MFDTEKLISEIEKRPALYNIKLKEYSNRDIKIKLWEEIAVEMYDNWDTMTVQEKNKLGKELQIKWKSIRDQFRREVNALKQTRSGDSAKKKRKYIYFDQLLFLTAHAEVRDTITNLNNDAEQIEENMIEENMIEENMIENEVMVQENPSPRPGPSRTTSVVETKKSTSGKRTRHLDDGVKEFKEITKLLSESVAVRKQDRESDALGNRAFLLSLLPLMNKLPEDILMDARMQIMEVLRQCQRQSRSPFPQFSTSSSSVTPTPNSVSSEVPYSPQYHELQYSDTYDLYDM